MRAGALLESRGRDPATGEARETGLFLPTLQPEPFAVRRIDPSPCTQACPAGVQVKTYVSLIAEGKFSEALEVVRDRCPLPGICGRVCTHPCELACRRQEIDEPIAIRSLKRFVADQEVERRWREPVEPPERPSRVAIIGSGPAGLTAAYDLRRAGFPTTIFEAEAEPGGMLRHGIAAYRLPRDILDREIEVLQRSGLEIRTGLRLGLDLDLEQLLREGFEAILLAVGAQIGSELGIPGAGGRSTVVDALAFLRRVNAGERPAIAGAVVVIGGGSTAIEAARSALRLGASSVEVVYRRSRREMPASTEEVEVAESEGVRFHFQVQPTRAVEDDGGRFGLICVRVALGEPDRSGRPRPMPLAGTEFHLPADRVIAAVGQKVDLGFLPSLGRTKAVQDGSLIVDRATWATRLARVFAAGDVVTGPATIIDAIAAGHRAASSMQRFLTEGKAGGNGQDDSPLAPEYEVVDPPPARTPRLHPALVGVKRGWEFREVEQPFTRRQAMAEARRCLRCGPCAECRLCASTCRRRHVALRPRDGAGAAARTILRVPATISAALDASRPTGGSLVHDRRAARANPQGDAAPLEIEVLPLRTTIRPERCRACAACVHVCPFDAVTLADANRAWPRALVEPSLCRGCNLCYGVCPTGAAMPSAITPDRWGSRFAEMLRERSERLPLAPGHVVLACQRRAEMLEPALRRLDAHLDLIRVRCLGQIEAGLLIDLACDGDSRVLVAGCTAGRCRYGSGSALAWEQVEISRAILRSMGRNPLRVVADWSPGGEGDRLDDPIARLVGMGVVEDAAHAAGREMGAADG